MPALPSTALLDTLFNRSAIVTNATYLQVVCAWPVSPQYGPGSRALYYVLIAACVFARKVEWLRNACLAVALLFPAIAALHGIILATVHVNSAVDMDIYGAFQLCSIGILAIPVLVKLPRFHVYGPVRNILFLWTGLILAGLLSLTVEFSRIETSVCTDDSGNPSSFRPGGFPYNSNPTCGLTCSASKGPHSPLRRGSQSDIYIIPAPDKLTFGTATLLAAACCIPAVLSLTSIWNKIFKINWKTHFSNKDVSSELIEGTNSATPKVIDHVKRSARKFLNVVELPVFSAAVLAILIIGEINFFTDQVMYQTEPIASIGQWGPIAGAGLGILGSLYVHLASDQEDTEEGAKLNDSKRHRNSSQLASEATEDRFIQSLSSFPSLDDTRSRSRSSSASRETKSEIVHSVYHHEPPIQLNQHRTVMQNARRRSVAEHGNQLKESTTIPTVDVGNRQRVARMMKKFKLSNLGSAAQDRFDDSEFKHGPALDFPQIPGEAFRNKNLPQIIKQYNLPRETDDYTVGPSRAGSFTGSIDLGVYSPAPSRGVSPHLRSPQSCSTTLPAHQPLDTLTSLQRGRRRRKDTLQVPPVKAVSFTGSNARSFYTPTHSRGVSPHPKRPINMESRDLSMAIRASDAACLAIARSTSTFNSGNGQSQYNDLSEVVKPDCSSPEDSLAPVLDPMRQALVGQVMEEFWVIFNRDLEIGVREHTGRPSSSSSKGPKRSFNSLSDKTLLPSQRKRQRDDDDEPNDSNRDNSHNPPQPIDSSNGLESVNRFACPFRKRDAQRYSIHSHRVCALSYWKTIARVKEHLYRCHQMVPYCKRCWKTFKTPVELDVHLTVDAAKICETQPGFPPEGITPQHEKQLRSRKKFSPNQSDEDRWKDIYRLLFPNEEVPSSSGSVQNEDEMKAYPYNQTGFEPVRDEAHTSRNSPNLSNYQNYTRRELPRLVRSRIEELVLRDIQPLETLIQILPGIIRDCQDGLFEAYCATYNETQGVDNEAEISPSEESAVPISPESSRSAEDKGSGKSVNSHPQRYEFLDRDGAGPLVHLPETSNIDSSGFPTTPTFNDKPFSDSEYPTELLQTCNCRGFCNCINEIYDRSQVQDESDHSCPDEFSAGDFDISNSWDLLYF